MAVINSEKKFVDLPGGWVEATVGTKYDSIKVTNFSHGSVYFQTNNDNEIELSRDDFVALLEIVAVQEIAMILGLK